MKDRRDIIGDKARDVFFAKGYKAASLQDISIKGKMSKATIYHYYKDKEDILLSILIKNAEDGIAALKQILQKNHQMKLDYRKSFESVIEAYASHLLKNRKISLLVLRERAQLSEESRNALLEKEKSVFRLIKSGLSKIPNLNRELNLNIVSFQIMSMIHWMGYWFDEKGSLSKEAAVEQTISIIFNGMLCKKYERTYPCRN